MSESISTPEIPRTDAPQPESGRTVAGWVLGCVYLLMLLIWLLAEGRIWLSAGERGERLQGWLSGSDPDWLPYLPWLLLFPLCWLGSRRRVSRKQSGWLRGFLSESPRSEKSALGSAWAAAILVGGFAFWMSWRTGQEFTGLPPAYHDEYSYLFQAETFRQGRWAFPSFSPRRELFDQMHVLNEGYFASRYFPGNGAWITPFLMLGHPWLGHQLALAIAAMLVFWIGCELANTGTGLLAGGLCAVSPGLILFSNLLLAHLPTLVGLLIFLWAFLKWMRTGQIGLTILAGTGLAFAMLCRPMTAAGFALPFGLYFACWWLFGVRLSAGDERSPLPAFVERTRTVAAMAIPLAAGFLVIFVQNYFVTGAILKSPYQTYHEIYTPRHVYGFSNATRGGRESGPLVSDRYDRWAVDLTPTLARQNVSQRGLQSLRWIMGIFPLIAAGLSVLCTFRREDSRWGLLAASIVMLHVAHIPYWFVGIMGWHYVFESAPLWILIFAEGTRRLLVGWSARGERSLILCWLGMTATAVLVNLTTVSPIWGSRLQRGVAEVRYPRQIYAAFREQVDELRNGRPAIVFVKPDPDDVSMDYVTNPPGLSGPVLVARLPDFSEAAELADTLFSDRVPILFDAQRRQFMEIKVSRDAGY